MEKITPQQTSPNSVQAFRRYVGTLLRVNEAKVTSESIFDRP